jgi:hypothetical protein
MKRNRTQLSLGAKPIVVDDKNLLGIGGEARVYRFGSVALKLYHPIDPQQGKQLAQQSLRLRQEKLLHFPTDLPAQVAAPLELVHDQTAAVVGFSMPLVQGATDFSRLSQRKWRDGAISNNQLMALFRQLHGLLTALHHRGVIVGDLNHANVVFAQSAPWIIDSDSMQFGDYPCAVAHERFLDPKLFGLALLDSPRFSSATDWYAFSVLLFSSLLFVHPYGGVQRDYPTLLRRAEAAHSVLRQDVIYPKNAVAPDVLGDGLLAFFRRVFDEGWRGEFPAQLLQLHWTRCSCGTEHASVRCPQCALIASAPTPAARVIKSSGRCTAKTVFRTTGRIVHATVQGGLRYLYQEGDAVYRETGQCVLKGRPHLDLSFAICGDTTWVAQSGQAVAIRDGRQIDRVNAGCFGIQSMVAANSRQVFTTDGPWLVEQTTGKRMGQVLEGQTFFSVGEEMGLGLYRAGLVSIVFAFDTARPGLRHLALPPIQGRIVALEATFAGEMGLLALVTEQGGKSDHSLVVISKAGEILGARRGTPDSDPLLPRLQGKTLYGGRIVAATIDGLVALGLDRTRGEIAQRALFGDTAPFVVDDAELLRGPGGSIYQVTNTEIHQLILVSHE